MREIKFRAWDKESKEMGEVLTIQFHNGEVVLRVGGLCRYLQIRNVELLEYIDKKDKNGKEICEGDIVHTFSRVGRGFRDRGIDKVRYSNITARWYPLDLVVTEMCEVVGNDWENPGLV